MVLLLVAMQYCSVSTVLRLYRVAVSVVSTVYNTVNT